MRWVYEDERELQVRASEVAGPRPAPPSTLCANGCGYRVVPANDAPTPSASEYIPGGARTCAFYHSHWEDSKCVYSSTVCWSETDGQGHWTYGPRAACSPEDRERWVEYYRASYERTNRYWTALSGLCAALSGRRGAAFHSFKEISAVEVLDRLQRAEFERWWATTGKAESIKEILAVQAVK
jgi:hypothetical protein